MMPTPTGLLREVRRFIEDARPDGASDPQLLARFAENRDERAFAELVRRHGPMVLGVCRRVLRNAADAEDALQATFLILVRKAADIHDPERLGPWLYGVAWRTANKLRTSRKPIQALPSEIAEPAVDRDWPIELDEAIARLPEKYRTPIVLCHLQGLSTAEVAGKVGCPPATIVTRLFRARATLRRRLTALGITAPASLVGGSVLQLPSVSAAAISEMAAGRTISPAAAQLAEGVVRSILMTKIRWAATAVVAFSLMGVSILGFQADGQEPAKIADKTIPPVEPKPLLPPPVIAEKNDPAESGTVITANFRVTAPSTRIARLIANTAERTRKDVALLWLGKELPAWKKPCPVQVTISKGAGGATTFDFSGSNVPSMDMQVEGALDQLLADVVPHEVTHCVMADHFREPLPRWVDEGISLLSETEEAHARHFQLFQTAAKKGELMQIRVLFESKNYPSQHIGAFFAESFCVTRMLLEKKDRPTLIAFTEEGLKSGWAAAAKLHYGYESLVELKADLIRSINSVVLNGTTKDLPIPPVLALARVEAGRVVVYLPGNVYVSMTTMRKRERTETRNGKETLTPSFEPVTSYVRQSDFATSKSFAKGKVKAQSLDGKPIDEARMLELLKGSAKPVVLASSPRGIDPAFAEILKQDTLVLILPAEAPPSPPLRSGR